MCRVGRAEQAPIYAPFLGGSTALPISVNLIVFSGNCGRVNSNDKRRSSPCMSATGWDRLVQANGWREEAGGGGAGRAGRG